MLCFQLYPACCTVLQMKNSRRNASAINPATMKNMDDTCIPTIIITNLKSEVAFTLCFHLFTAHYTAFEDSAAISQVTMKNTDDFHLQMGSHASRYCELTLWTVSKKKWDTKEDKGKSMIRAFYVLQYAAKRHING